MLHPTTHFHHVLQNVAARSLVGLDVNNPNCHQEVAVFVCALRRKGRGGRNKENVQCTCKKWFLDICPILKLNVAMFSVC